MSKTDSAGNYFFDIDENTYKIFPMTWRDKRVLRGKVGKVLTSEGELDTFSEGFYELQDWVLSKVDYIGDNGPLKLNSPDVIENHFTVLNIDVLEGVDRVFNHSLEYLAGNFITPAVEQSDPTNSQVDAGDSSRNQNTPTMLSQTLRE